MRLSELKTGESATILKVLGHGGFRRRIMEMGFVRGQRVEVVLNAPLEDPIEYKIMGYGISLRRSEADMIVVLSDAEVQHLIEEERHSGNRRDALRRISEIILRPEPLSPNIPMKTTPAARPTKSSPAKAIPSRSPWSGTPTAAKRRFSMPSRADANTWAITAA